MMMRATVEMTIRCRVMQVLSWLERGYFDITLEVRPRSRRYVC